MDRLVAIRIVGDGASRQVIGYTKRGDHRARAWSFFDFDFPGDKLAIEVERREKVRKEKEKE